MLPTAAGADVINERFPINDFYLGCNGELITFQGTNHILLKTDPESGQTLFHLDQRGTGINEATGERYVISGTGTTSSPFGVDANAH